MARPRRRRLRALLVTAAASAAVVVPATSADAHSLESSTVSVHLDAAGTVDATISVAQATLDTALATAPEGEDVASYLADHLALTDADGHELTETFSDVSVEQVEGIASYVVDVAFDTGGGADTSALRLTYDAVIEAEPDHEAVVVLTDAAGEVSTAGVLTADADAVQLVGEASAGASDAATGWLDMIGLGLHHVLDGADHLLFLLTLLLTAPLLAVAGRWQRDTSARRTLHNVLGVVTAFTLGHSVTLIAASLGWVHLPTRLVEVLVAASVAVAAAHAIRPIVHRGETWIAAGFGLVHGLAFAGILADLGLTGTTSVPDLLAFNVGVELAQLSVVALTLPSLHLLATTRAYDTVRIAAASLALVVAGGWIVERLGLATSPFTGLETAAIDHLWWIAAALAAVAAITRWHSGAWPGCSPGTKD